MVQRWREPVSVLPTGDVVAAKTKEGWRPVAIEWERERDVSSLDSQRRPIPYGLRISSDCSHLQIDPVEREVMTVVLAMVAADHSLSKVAAELNRRDYRTRDNTEWTQVALFKMLPRIVEVGPEILGADEWPESKKNLLSAVS